MAELEDFACDFAARLTDLVKQADSDKAVVIGLRGELGAGKTAFTKEVVKIFGNDRNVTSPTFVILKNYALPEKDDKQKFSRIVHIDAYRLKNAHELEVLGWADILADKNNLVLIEWPEIVSDIMPDDTIYLDFKHVDEITREIHEK